MKIVNIFGIIFILSISFSFVKQYLAERRQARDESLESIIKTYFQKEYEARKKLHEDEIAELAR